MNLIDEADDTLLLLLDVLQQRLEPLLEHPPHPSTSEKSREIEREYPLVEERLFRQVKDKASAEIIEEGLGREMRVRDQPREPPC